MTNVECLMTNKPKNRSLKTYKIYLMQNKAFITVVFIFILSISGWAQKKKPTQKSDIKYYQSLGASSKVANLMTQMTLDEKIGQ